MANRAIELLELVMQALEAGDHGGGDDDDKPKKNKKSKKTNKDSDRGTDHGTDHGRDSRGAKQAVHGYPNSPLRYQGRAQK